MTIEEKLQHLKSAAIEDAHTQSNAIITEYQDNLDTLFAEYKAEKMAQADITIKAETADVEHKINKALANQHLEVKSRFTRKQHELKKKLFAEVRDLLTAYKETDKYMELLVSQVNKAKEISRQNNFHVLIDASDKALQSSLSTRTGVDIRISEESFFGGTQAIIPSRHILIDESFKNRLHEARESFVFQRKQA